MFFDEDQVNALVRIAYLKEKFLLSQIWIMIKHINVFQNALEWWTHRTNSKTNKHLQET